MVWFQKTETKGFVVDRRTIPLLFQAFRRITRFSMSIAIARVSLSFPCVDIVIVFWLTRLFTHKLHRQTHEKR